MMISTILCKIPITSLKTHYEHIERNEGNEKSLKFSVLKRFFNTYFIPKSEHFLWSYVVVIVGGRHFYPWMVQKMLTGNWRVLTGKSYIAPLLMTNHDVIMDNDIIMTKYGIKTLFTPISSIHTLAVEELTVSQDSTGRDCNLNNCAFNSTRAQCQQKLVNNKLYKIEIVLLLYQR